MLETCWWVLIGIGVFFLLVGFAYLSFGVIKAVLVKRKLKKWANITKKNDVLIVHTVPKAKNMPSASPFVMKLLAFLRMAEIPYELDHTDPFGGKGKTPWISVQGENVADTEFIISFLNKKYGKNLNDAYPEDQIAAATAVRTMVDEHLFWGMALERFVFGGKNLLQVINIPSIMLKIIKPVLMGRAESQGIGLHAEEDIVQIMSKDLRIVSKVLGDKNYILGEKPCQEDAGIFGQISQFCWGLPNSPYEQLLSGDCSNLRDYCFRIKERYFQDWK